MDTAWRVVVVLVSYSFGGRVLGRVVVIFVGGGRLGDRLKHQVNEKQYS